MTNFFVLFILAATDSSSVCHLGDAWFDSTSLHERVVTTLCLLFYSSAPDIKLCGAPGCQNAKKYSCSKTGVPLCSLGCYKRNMAASQTVLMSLPPEFQQAVVFMINSKWTDEFCASGSHSQNPDIADGNGQRLLLRRGRRHQPQH